MVQNAFSFIRLFLVFAFAASLPACAEGALDKLDEDEYGVLYHIALAPQSKSAQVSISLPEADKIVLFDFKIDSKYHTAFSGNGEISISQKSVKWVPPAKNAKLTFNVAINRPRKNSSGKQQFDAYIAQDWAIFRGDDLVPAARVRTKPGAKSKSILTFDLPKGWKSVNSGWALNVNSDKEDLYIIDNPSRNFDRPTGWFIAGDLGTRRAKLGNTYVSVSAPKASNYRRMDMLTLLTFVWPQVDKTFEKTPSKILIVGAGTPMWSGGLSSPNSLYIHEDRPLISENGTSTVLHEIFHVVSGISGGKQSDWIAEGLAEFYAIEWLYRAGGLTERRRTSVLEDLDEWSKDVTTLKAKRSSGSITAKAVLYFEELNKRIIKQTNGKNNLDSFVSRLFGDRDVTEESLIALCNEYQITCPSMTYSGENGSTGAGS